MRVAITGCATGIGAATAAKLLQRGDQVVAFDIQPPAGAFEDFIRVDLADPGAIAAAAKAATGAFDVLINNAGLPPRPGQEEKVLAVNVFGVTAFTEVMAPKMNPGGAIVTTASRAGQRWRENLAQVKALLALPGPSALPAFVASEGIEPVRAYDLSKEAVIVWTMRETARLNTLGLRANTVSPAAVTTGILDDFITAFGDRARNAIARVDRPVAPEEVADLILFLAGPESAYIKGGDFEIDGGMAAIAQAESLGLLD